LTLQKCFVIWWKYNQVHVNKGTIFGWTDDNENIPLHVVIVSTIAKPISISMMSLTVTLPYLEGLKFAQPVTANGKLH